MGDFGGMQLEDRANFSNEFAAKFLFLFTTLTTQVVMLNMLIALMSQTFSDYTEREDEYQKTQRL